MKKKKPTKSPRGSPIPKPRIPKKLLTKPIFSNPSKSLLFSCHLKNEFIHAQEEEKEYWQIPAMIESKRCCLGKRVYIYIYRHIHITNKVTKHVSENRCNGDAFGLWSLNNLGWRQGGEKEKKKTVYFLRHGFWLVSLVTITKVFIVVTSYKAEYETTKIPFCFFSILKSCFLFFVFLFFLFFSGERSQILKSLINA